METHGLDVAHSYTLPGFSWKAARKYTGQEIELVHDREKYDFIEGAKRGGISTVTKRYGRANNPYMGKEYDPEKPTKYIMYFDENNLYEWSMSQPLPHRVTDWMSEDELNLPLEEMPPCFIEADLDYPVELHDYFSDFVPAPDNIIPEGSKVKKLTPNLFSKKNYVCHIRNLILYKNLGVKITKIRRALKFDESPWLKPYIDLNTDLRTKAKNRSDYDTYKLMNNAVFGKTCENKLNRTDYRLSSSRNEVRKFIARPTFKDVTAYNKTRLAFLHAKLQIQNEPIFSQPCRIFWSLVTNLILEKFPKFIEIILVRVFLYGDLRAIGRLRVSRGSK